MVERSGAITVRRLIDVSPELATAMAMAPLFDDGVAWDATEGDRFLANPDCLFVLAEAGDVPIGFLTAYRLQRFDRRRSEVQLYEIGVDDAWQRRGAARALVAELDRWCREIGANEYWVITEADNIAANGLYTATGGAPDPSDLRMYTYGLNEPSS